MSRKNYPSYRCSPQERVQQCVSVQRDGCWIWQLSKFRSGYGLVRVSGRNLLAHRFAYEAFVGKIPPGAMLCHHCNVKACCNPRHLYVGDKITNAEDVVRVGTLRGSRHPRANFTEDQVREIRTRYRAGGLRHIDLANEFGVNRMTITRLINGRNWGHVV